MNFDLNLVYAVILAFTLLTTLRLSITGQVDSQNPVLRVVTNRNWFYALIIAGPYVLGAFYRGAMSPWPPTAFATASERAGLWAGVATVLGVAIADIWLLWGTATVFARFAPPAEKRFVKYYYLANLAIGIYLMLRFTGVIHIGANLLPTSAPEHPPR